MGVIRTLSDEVINNLAAGEVVERPASVLKELVENSLDAGATEVEVAIVAGGAKLIRVSDNGRGMSAEDAVHCFGRHATSKIEAVDDLTHLGSLGFRGEALAAIAAVSEINLKTRLAEKDIGTEVALSGGDIQSVREAGVPLGTRFEIKNLFFNTPARRKFLKKEQTEGKWLETHLKALALSAPHVSFRFIQEGKPKWQMLAYDRDESEEAPIHEERVAACLGGQVRGHLLNFEGRTEDLEVSGYLVSPEVTRRDTKGVRLTVNGRWVSDRILTQTVKAAYGPYLEPGRYPLCILHLTLPKDTIDFNVHPQKSEVRISNRREVQAQLVRLITVFLVTKRPAAMFGKASSVHYAMNRNEPVNPENNAPRDWFPAPQNSVEALAPKAAPHLSEDHALDGAPLMGRYTFLETGEGLWLLDVHQFLRFELEQRLTTQLETGSLTKQRLLFPLQVDAPNLQEANLEETENALDVMGFEISVFDEEKWMLKSIPSALAEENVLEMFSRVLRAILNGHNQDLKNESPAWLEKLVAPVTPSWRHEEWPGIKSRALEKIHRPVAQAFCVPVEEHFFAQAFKGRK